MIGYKQIEDTRSSGERVSEAARLRRGDPGAYGEEATVSPAHAKEAARRGKSDTAGRPPVTLKLTAGEMAALDLPWGDGATRR